MPTSACTRKRESEREREKERERETRGFIYNLHVVANTELYVLSRRQEKAGREEEYKERRT